MALIMVGAIFVSCMETVWGGLVNPSMGMRLQRSRFGPGNSPAVNLQRGEEMGVFNMGSTVILLFGPDRIDWVNELQPGSPVRLGQVLGNIISQE
jgi:phosphatidylserine decarboxylase